MSPVRRRIPDQLIRLGVAFGVLVAAVLLVRAYVVPDSMKSASANWARAAEKERERPIHYAGATICKECHDGEAEAKQTGNHRDLSCETCHGPAAAHVEAPDETTPMVPRDRSFCPICHAYDPSRPTGFPQINPASHNPLRPCISCHDPHAPVPPQTPHDCGACHSQIARTKATSAHALLECVVCHQTPEEHLNNPRAALPSVPASREFCGRCHAPGASERPEAPRIDLASHGEKYLCWQCHYPHLPEGR